MNDQVTEFLSESNLIEGVTDPDSLKQAIVAWDYLVQQKELTHGVVLKTHKLLMLHQPKLRPNERGYYREKDVKIGHYEFFTDWGSEKPIVLKKFVQTGKAIDYKTIRGTMDMWLHIANKVTTADFPEQWAKQSHIAFELIHPFMDGNGRLGRMLLNWERLKVRLPILVIYNNSKQDYYSWFR